MFQTTHKLEFEAAPYEWDIYVKPLIDDGFNWSRFRIGTCEGLWCAKDRFYCILAITNNSIGNGHFEDVLEWFEYSCKRDWYGLRIMEIMNNRFKKHLVEKRGFTEEGDGVIKYPADFKLRK